MDSRSGGKIVTKRHRRHTATPYDRVPASSQPAARSPNWLTRVIVPATRMIASGANKIISTVFDSDESSSSSSLSSPDSGHASENDFDNGNPDNPYSTYSLNEDHGTTSEAMKSISREPKLNSQNNAKQVEQLLMQGKFSRQECDRFIEIIKSRVMDSGEDNVQFETADGGLDDCADDNLCNKAVTEARKWLEEKRVAFSPISNMADGASALNSLQFGNEVGSPADVAKQYVKSRSPWGSPSVEHVELRTPATMISPLFREGTSLAAGHESLSSFKKRASLASGSWNIQEEIRRVRARATEDMLNSSPSKRNALSVYASSPNLSFSRGEDEGKELNSVYITPTERTDLDTASRMVESQSFFAIPASAVLDKYRPKTDVECAISNLSPPFPDLSKEDVESRLIRLKESMEDRYGKSDVTETANDLPASQATLPTEVDAGEIQTKVNEESANGAKSDAKTANDTTPIEDRSAILSEASVEVPIVDETDAMGNVSLPVSNELGGTMIDELPAKPEEKKPARSSRRGRGRIKG